MIIEHGQRMTASPAAQGKVTFEIHLPELIGDAALKAPIRLMLRSLGLIN